MESRGNGGFAEILIIIALDVSIKNSRGHLLIILKRVFTTAYKHIALHLPS